ncbi:MAG: SBBP repeat-containing protein, partial [Candidatus Helarchaeota archaeon]
MDRSLQEANNRPIPTIPQPLKALQSNETPYNQIWNRTWGEGTDESANGIVMDADGSIYITGGTGSSIMFLTKYNSSGDQLWNVTWGISSWDLAHAVTIDINGSVYVVGEGMSYSMGFEDAFLAKYNSSGTLLWNVTWGSVNQDMANAVTVDSNGFIYVAGRTDIAGFPTQNWDGFLLKFYPNGTKIWNYTWGGSGDDRFEGVALDSNGFIYTSGSTGTSSNDGMLLKYAPNGTQLWIQTWGGGSSDGFNAIAISSNDSIYLAGYTNSYAIGGSDGLLIKYDTDGNLLWNRTWGGGGDEYYRGLVVGSNGSIYTAGYTSSFGAGGTDATFVKYASNGTLLWNQTWGGGGNDVYNDIARDSTGFLYLAGYTASFGAGGNDALIVKYLGLDSDGDGLSDILENFYGTNPANPDTDNDGLLDGEEVLTYNTNATNPDTDWDLIPDGWEVLNSLNPLNNDSLSDPDNDSLSNLQEYQYNCNPQNPDTDSDGLNDSVELLTYFTNATNPDTDSDGLNDSVELFTYFTNATNPDTDSDGLNDSVELFTYFTNATNPDTDSDGLNDSVELLTYFTNATNPDTDSDGLNDSVE